MVVPQKVGPLGLNTSINYRMNGNINLPFQFLKRSGGCNFIHFRSIVATRLLSQLM